MLIKFIFLLFSFFVLVQSACFDNGDKEVKGLCYKFVPQKLAYEDARNWCHYQNPVTSSYLAYVPDASTSSFLASYARTAFGSNNVNFWIGLSRNNSNRQWFWDNGASVGFTYFDILGSGNYVAESTVNAKWNTFLGTEIFYFACSYDPQAPPTFAPPKTTTIANVPVSTPPVPTTTVNSKWNTFMDTEAFYFACSYDPQAPPTFAPVSTPPVPTTTGN
ncbi:hypothetical protein L3Y34_019251 [Caenorhabditis briggsae]|uniref:C-type lectin domain-containing protein n=1 Tax=Caenorhabditis briggsae TaxID=6238 RepID=A0AAE9DNN4_CAEBR|nr:hypothetical protein L3Y34_019251 [Caenorhabditis briggsae]